MSSPRPIVEAALTDYLTYFAGITPTLSGVSVLPGQSTDDRPLPVVIVYASGAAIPDGLPEGLGNYSVEVQVTLLSSADDTQGDQAALTAHQDRLAALTDALRDTAIMRDNWPAGSRLYDLTLGDDTEARDGRKLGNTISLRALVCVGLAG
jgi:hypothetical protein